LSVGHQTAVPRGAGLTYSVMESHCEKYKKQLAKTGSLGITKYGRK